MAYLLGLFSLLAVSVQGLRYDPAFVDYNLNQNQQATNPLDYSASRPGHTYFQSPDNWRFPFYTLFLDRYVNGDPTNDNANGTIFEQDLLSNQLRHGGDLQGLIDSLDYIQGMGIKGIYIAGSPFINLPWGVDSYSPIDLSLLDFHFGDIKQWQTTVDEIHKRGMYVLLDHTMATMSDLFSFDGFENITATFDAPREHNAKYKTSRQYLDFSFSNDDDPNCVYPRFYNETGLLIDTSISDTLKGCKKSEFDQYGDIEAFGVHPDWQRALAKFASVQDRLREWNPTVREKLQTFSCMAITMLDIDGFRFDKATQLTVDALAAHNAAVRACAKKLGKDNFFLPGEITGGNDFGSIYIGRGRQSDSRPKFPDGFNVTSKDSKFFIRDADQGALDAGAFHYSVYRTLTRFLGMSGNLEAGFDIIPDWVEMWNAMVITNDMLNSNTGKFDPRHMLGVTNQDVFRWPAITDGIQRMLLGFFITTLHMPGLPLVYYGEEQALYALDNTAENYIYGRQAFSGAQAWKLHGCHRTNSSQYIGWPVDAARNGCNDEKVAYDHRDPSHPVRNIMKSMYGMRNNFKGFAEAWNLKLLQKQTFKVILDGSNKTESEFGLWSVARSTFAGIQTEFPEDVVWLLYHNQNTTVTYKSDCKNTSSAIYGPYDHGKTAKNLFYPYDEVLLEDSTQDFGFGSFKTNAGCLSSVTMKPYEFRAYVLKGDHKRAPTTITKFEPGHDARINSASANGAVNIVIGFSDEMDCDGVTKAISIATTGDGNAAVPKIGKATCNKLASAEVAPYVGSVGTEWTWAAPLTGVVDGVHQITIKNAPTKASGGSTNTTDHFFIRVGAAENPVVFPESANYSTTLVTREGGDLFVNHKATGADKWRYSTNWGSSWSDYQDYKGGKNKIDLLPWNGTDLQRWDGDHVQVQYWSKTLGTSAILQEGDSTAQYTRRFPHVFAMGLFNKFGFDGGLRNQFQLTADGRWELHFMDEWPTKFQLNIWGMNPDSQPDQSYILGDVDADFILDRLQPTSLSENVLNVTTAPPMPALAYRLVFNDENLSFQLEPQGNMWIQIILFILLATLPIVGGLLSVWIFMGSFYKVKINKVGFKKRGRSPFRDISNRFSKSFESLLHKDEGHELAAMPGKRRKVIIATMEYNIDDWNLKIKIGGLGVMAQLMGKALEHQDLIWVIPCVGGLDYPIDQRAEPMYPIIMGKEYEIEVQYHQVGNITYVLLDAPIFRKQTKNEPYPPRMDDMDSAIYYSAWNSCIAEAIRRFKPDLYHINDYHGAAAPLYLLPDTIPCALSLHNAEFQGMWPMRTPEESKEVCEVFNLDPEVVKEYVQFGSVFNLLHAGASYLRVHQKGFGAVGVSKKYGDRSYARYPIFWGLSKIGQLPNPDPSDTAEWTRDEEVKEKDVVVDQEAEGKRGELRKQAQEWAGLEIDPTAELFVFVGRWSLQKGVDLIADIFPSILEKYPKTQLICIGPVIDLYGKFAALKLEKLMEKYPKRVYSKPEFTALPPYIFSGAEFALIPSRDEPFGLVAVEFGRKGALGVGARVGGLGQMPGFWYTVESTSAKHLLHQFRTAIVRALDAKTKTRVNMRAWSAKQRFPVKQWVEDLDTLQSEAIRIHQKESKKRKRLTSGSLLTVPSNVDLAGNNQRYYDESDIETPSHSRSGSPSRNRSSSLSQPFITGPPEDEHGAEGGADEPLMAPSLPFAGGEGSSSQQGLYANPSNRSSVSSLNTIVANDPAGNRLSVDSFAMRMMSPDVSETRAQPFGLVQARPGARDLYSHRNSSRLSVIDVVGERQDFKLQKVDPFFTDSTGEYYKTFEDKLSGLTAKNSDTELVIEDFLKESEKEWFKNFRDAKLGRSRSPSRSRAASPGPSLLVKKNRHSRVHSVSSVNSLAPSEDELNDEDRAALADPADRDDEFLLGTGYKPPRGLKKFMQRRFGDWPVYSFLLALGQIMAANSYQIVLLAGESGQTAQQLLIVSSTYGVFSLVWWFMFRRLKSLYALSLPWFIYGLAFILLGVTPFFPQASQFIVSDVATALYAAAASSGSLFFAFNFGDEGGAPLTTWIFRAAVIQGIQQLYILGLFYWGSIITGQNPQGAFNGIAIAGKVPLVLVIAAPVGIILMLLGVISFIGLPDYYRQSADKIPAFYHSLIRRRIVPWFFLMVIVQNYFLSTPYGRNWQFLFYSRAVPSWSMVLLALGFFVILWGVLLYIFSFFSKTHPWIVPLFSIGLCAPRWAQMLWGTSGIGLFLPWAGPLALQAIISRCLWLWLGVLDTIQGVGLGMVLLLTLTRQHVAATLMGAQVIGSAMTILARFTAPDKVGPGDVFPDFSEGITPGITKPWFWVALGLQLIIPIGFFKFFRKEQVAKP